MCWRFLYIYIHLKRRFLLYKVTVITILDMQFIRARLSENIDAQNEWLWLKNINIFKVARGT